MTFLDTRFPVDISQGSSFGPKWQTQVIRLGSGFEQRTQRWEDTLYAGDVAYGVTTRARVQQLIAFFQEMRGRAYSFRFKDWADYEATDVALTVDGGPTTQLVKVYGGGLNDYTRYITKPVSGTVALERNGGSFTAWSLDYTTGIVTLTADSTASISNIAQDASGTVTATAHGFTTGDEIYIDGVAGMTEVNESVYTITVVDVDTFTIGTDTTGFTAYTSGGTAYKYIQSDEALTWSGQFDVHCRFDTDEMSAMWEDYKLQSASVPIAEVR